MRENVIGNNAVYSQQFRLNVILEDDISQVKLFPLKFDHDWLNR